MLFSDWRLAMKSFPDLSTQANRRELLDRYLDNLFGKDRSPSLRSGCGA